jgi:hypothetical protein
MNYIIFSCSLIAKLKGFKDANDLCIVLKVSHALQDP